LADTRLKIAVFIDFDNIEIGVKSTLGVQFDIGVVLEALKERGDVVSKIAYGDWTRAGDYSRSLTQHATKLVQRNLTPGGDKNGADINLALDALEMAFTHGHINAYVIVGGDSDFITLVEKLKQYDKQIFVVGGRAFTSMVMQRNCHEFIAYENLVNSGRRSSADRGRASAPVAQTSIEVAVPLVRRALKVLSDREVSPQLGLLKSTLLQLDSTFSERTYGAGSFRDFAQKLASAGHVVLRESGRNVLVELAEGSAVGAATEETREPRENRPPQYSQPQYSQPQPRREAAEMPQPAPAETGSTNGGEPEPRTADGIREVRRLFQSAQNPPRWPMYIRQAKQFLRNIDASFDERKFGFASLVDLLRACQREGLFRIERDRQGVMRVFPGNIMQAAERTREEAAGDDDNRGNVAAPAPIEDVADESPAVEWTASVTSIEAEVVEGAVVQEMNAAPPVLDGEATVEESDAALEPSTPGRRRSRGGRGRGKSAGAAKAASEPRAEGRRKSGEGAAPKARKTPAKPRAARTRSRKETPAL
jgi:uncharacterized LabA/DUF88 family protein